MQLSFISLGRRGLVVAALAVAACGGTKNNTKPTPVENPPPQTPKGETLRIKAKASDKMSAKGKLIIEFDAPMKQGKKTVLKHVALDFSLAVDEKVESVDANGNAQVSARLGDAIGKSDGLDAKMVDDFALAIDELKIQMTRTPRGEILSVNINGVRAPLDDRVARSVVNALFSASRGAVLPDGPVEQGAKWKTESQVALGPNAVGNAVYNYTFAKKEGNAVTIASDGSVVGELGPGKKVNGKISSEYKIDNEQGKLQTYSTDINSTIEDPSAPPDQKSGGQRIKVELNYGS